MAYDGDEANRRKIPEFYALTPGRFGLLKSLTLYQGVDLATGFFQQQLSIELAMDDSWTGEMLFLDFSNVRNLRIQQTPLSAIVLTNIEIDLAPSNGRFDGPIVVRDAEQEEFVLFSCEDFSATIASRGTPPASTLR